MGIVFVLLLHKLQYIFGLKIEYEVGKDNRKGRKAFS